MAVIKYKDVVIMKKFIALFLALLFCLSLPLSASAGFSVNLLEQLIDDLDDTATLDNAAAICYAGCAATLVDEGEAMPPNIEKLERLEEELLHLPFSVTFCIDYLRSYINAHDSFFLLSDVMCAKAIRNNELCYYYQVKFSITEDIYSKAIDCLIAAKPERQIIDIFTPEDEEYFDLSNYSLSSTDWAYVYFSERLASVLGCD